MEIPLVADLTKTISKDYGVLKEDDGIAYRSGFEKLPVFVMRLKCQANSSCSGSWI